MQVLFEREQEWQLGASFYCEQCDENPPLESCNPLVLDVASPRSHIIVSIARFSNNQGPAEKNRQPITLSETLVVGGNSYSLSAVVKHVGNTLRQGHYTCSRRSASHWVNIDDGRLEPEAPDFLAHDQDSTVLIYTRQSPLDHTGILRIRALVLFLSSCSFSQFSSLHAYALPRPCRRCITSLCGT